MEKADPESGLVWSVRPVAREPGRGAAAAAVVTVAAAGSAWAGGPVLGVLALLVLAGSVGPFFVRARYRLTEREVSVESPFQRVRRPWSDFRSVHVGRTGVTLSPFTGHHILEPYRSVLIRYGSHREEVLTWVRRYGPRPETER